MTLWQRNGEPAAEQRWQAKTKEWARVNTTEQYSAPKASSSLRKLCTHEELHSSQAGGALLLVAGGDVHPQLHLHLRSCKSVGAERFDLSGYQLIDLLRR